MTYTKLKELQELSSLQEQAHIGLATLKHKHRHHEPRLIERVTPARKVYREYTMLRDQIWTLGEMDLSPPEIAEYTNIPEHIVTAFLTSPTPTE